MRSFLELQNMLAEIAERLPPGIVSAAWDGRMMTIAINRPESGRSPFSMRFDDPSDYQIDGDALATQFSQAAQEHFG